VNTASQPLVSIVTPVYNGAEYLAECIESVLEQSYQNWDYTIVNNCSTDASGEIARRYAAKDSRIRVRENQEFLRVIPNHNVAFRQISPQSKYCKMIFADDWMFPDCIAQMVAMAEEYPSVGIVHAYSLQGSKVLWTGLPYSRRPVSGREVCRQLFLNGLYVFGSATAMLYRSDLVRSHDPFYNEANLHADTEATISLLRNCDFGFVHQVLAYSRERAGSLSKMSTDLNTHIAGSLHALVVYGPDYLTREELQGQLSQHLSGYYAFLGKGLLLGRDKAFWDYHKKKLMEAGAGFSRPRVLAGALKQIGRALLRPASALDKLLERRHAEAKMQDRESNSTVSTRRGGTVA